METNEELTYLLALKQEFRGFMKDSPFFVKADEQKPDIARYSDKYQIGQQEETEQNYPIGIFVQNTLIYTYTGVAK